MVRCDALEDGVTPPQALLAGHHVQPMLARLSDKQQFGSEPLGPSGVVEVKVGF